LTRTSELQRGALAVRTVRRLEHDWTCSRLLPFDIGTRMAKKKRKPLGSFGALAHRKEQFTVEKLDAALEEARQKLAELRAQAGGSLADHVFILADAHEGSKLMVKDLGGEAFEERFVGVVAKVEAARVLRIYDADAQALQVERPLEARHMRILYSAEGEVTIIDEPISE
jgi:hypothetical protein